MVKRCAWGTCKTDSRYPERLTKDGKIINFHPFPSEKKFKEPRLGNCRFVLLAGQMTLNVRRIAAYAACILWGERADRHRSKSRSRLLATASREKVCYVCVYCMSTCYFLFSNSKFILRPAP